MALYFPRYQVALEVTDDPLSMPVDLDAFPGMHVLSLTRAEVLNSVVLDRLAERMARDGARKGADAAEDVRTIKRRLRRVLDTSNLLELLSSDCPEQQAPAPQTAPIPLHA